MNIKKFVELSAWSIFLTLFIFTLLLTFQSIYGNDLPKIKDFLAFWSAAKLSINGHPELAYDIESMRSVVEATTGSNKSFTWLYPPTYQALIYPIGFLSYSTAYVITILFTSIIFIYLLILVGKKEDFVFIITTPTIFIGVIFGQNSAATASLAILSILYLRKSPAISGLSMGLLSIKPHLFLFLPLLAIVEKRWKVLAWATLTTLSTIAYSWLAFGSAPWISYFHNMHMASDWIREGQLKTNLMISVASDLINIGGLSATVISILHMTNFVVLVLLNLIVFKNTQNLMSRGSSILVLTLSFSPYMFIYELTLLAVACILTANAARPDIYKKSLLFLIWIYPAIDFLSNTISNNKPSLFFISCYFLMYINIKNSKASSL